MRNVYEEEFGVTAFEVERYLIPPENWQSSGAPVRLLEAALRESAQGYPTGLAKHPEYGWFLLMTGQGPAIVDHEPSDENLS